MAGRENQGYLIAVICLVLLSLFLALGTFYGISKMNEYSDNRADAEKKLNLANKLNQANQTKSMILETMIGSADLSVNEIDTQIDTLRGLSSGLADEAEREQIRQIEQQVIALRENYDQIVKAYSSAREGQDDRETTYKTIIDGLTSSLSKMHTEYTIKDRQRVLAETEKKQAEDDLNARIAQLQKEVTGLEQSLSAEKETARLDRQNLQAALDKNLAELKDLQRSHENVRSGLQKELADTSDNNKVLEENNDTLKTRINEITKEVFDRADGQIIRIDSQSRSAYIDIGRVHGLTENQAFAVYDKSVTNFEKGKEKGSIEVTRLANNQAEVNITKEDPTNPVLPGDWILSPTWESGQRVQFALAGVFDLDGDGITDMDRLIQMIRTQGGEVVVSHDDSGEIRGDFNPTIRFLVLGDTPSTGSPNLSGVSAAMSRLKNEAEANTVQIIDFALLLQRMGVRSQNKVELLSRGARDQGFQPRTPGSSLRSDDR